MTFQEFLDGFRRFDYNNPDFENMGSWPLGIKMLTLLIVIVAIIGGFYWFAIKNSYQELERATGREPSLKEEYQSKAFRVANLDAFKAQLAEMEETFGTLLNQLPDETEMPGLLDDISTTGTQSGLEIDRITPSSDVVREFYIETPITIAVRGSYHEMGNFVSAMSAIPRIVTLHDFNISLQGQGSVNSEAPLSMTIQARTYRYNPGGGQ
ncbi:type 4a pilus biogenesis protein PilO [Saccharospirillum salsuginis]|uniref:Type 4 fimbrial biogenesis protein PilO n=1 Tax=Saccharospirillum salsuginis TaxID=418750 RepID=A0A918K4Q9_9GAMM|nr:type 4a pilus biogenesis protein PilO [Saccharospirillum salsuginis]GGX44494.1 type 4 fimbrial biogenesis protein PilO [Saccharospirillum salsuginis]